MNNQKPNTMGIALGIVLCALACLTFPMFTNMVLWAAWIFYIAGFILLLLGLLGVCVEWFSGEGGKKRG